MKRTDQLQQGIDCLHGRLNALATVLITLARTLRRNDARQVGELLAGASEQISAEAIASTMPDLILQEQE